MVTLLNVEFFKSRLFESCDLKLVTSKESVVKISTLKFSSLDIRPQLRIENYPILVQLFIWLLTGYSDGRTVMSLEKAVAALHCFDGGGVVPSFIDVFWQPRFLIE